MNRRIFFASILAVPVAAMAARVKQQPVTLESLRSLAPQKDDVKAIFLNAEGNLIGSYDYDSRMLVWHLEKQTKWWLIAPSAILSSFLPSDCSRIWVGDTSGWGFGEYGPTSGRMVKVSR